MLPTWNKAHLELISFIEDNDRIRFNESRISVPKESRYDFWQLFEKAEHSFLNSYFYPPYKDALALGREYKRLEKSVMKQLKLTKETQSCSLVRFLHRPSSVLRENILSKQFVRLVKGSISIQEFREVCGDLIKESFLFKLRDGYRIWAIFSLIRLTQAQEAFSVPMISFQPYHTVVYNSEKVPDPIKIERLNLQAANSSLVMVPDLIVHTRNKYIAFKFQFTSSNKPRRSAFGLSNKKEWLNQINSAMLQPGITMINIGDNPKELSIFADKDNILRPDIILECRWGKSWLNKNNAKEMMKRFLQLRPKKSTFVLSNEKIDQEKFNELFEISNIELTGENVGVQQSYPILVNTGFDSATLQSIIEA